MTKKIALSLLALSSLAFAEETPFVTHTELGYIQTEGNTKTETFNLDAKASKSWDTHALGIKADAQYAKDGDVETKNRYAVELKYGYGFSERFSLGYLAGYKDDKFSGYDYQAYTGPDAIYKAIVSEGQNLSLEAAILYAQDKIEDAEKETYGAYRISLNYDLQLLENLKFTQEASYRASMEDKENYFVISKSALTSKISDILSAGLSYRVDYANIIPAQNVHTDKTLTANIIIDY